MNNGDPKAAVEGEGSSPILNKLYETLGSVQAGIDSNQEWARTARQQVLAEQKRLIDQRRDTQEGSPEFQSLTDQLDELHQAWALLNDEENGLAEPQPENGDTRPGSGDAGDGDPASAGGGQPVEGDEADRQLQRRPGSGEPSP